MVVCVDRLRVGGTLSGSAISGGTSLESGRYWVNWSGIQGYPPPRQPDVIIPFLDGAYPTEPTDDRPRVFYAPRQLSLAVAVLDRDEVGLLSGLTPAERMWLNLDTLLGLFYSEDLVLLEFEHPTAGKRWLKVRPSAQGSVNVAGSQPARQAIIPLEAPYPFWQDTTLKTVTVAGGGGTIPAVGNAPIAAFQASFSGTGVLTHVQSGATLGITGAGTTVVDVGKRTVLVGSTPAPERLERNRPWWMRLPAGVSNTFTRTGADVTLSYRDHWL